MFKGEKVCVALPQEVVDAIEAMAIKKRPVFKHRWIEAGSRITIEEGTDGEIQRVVFHRNGQETPETSVQLPRTLEKFKEGMEEHMTANEPYRHFRNF